MWTKPKWLVRKNTLSTEDNVWLQRDGSWGTRATARRFASQAAAEKGAAGAGIEVYGLFPASARRWIR